jgi:transcription elongation factor Elf1
MTMKTKPKPDRFERRIKCPHCCRLLVAVFSVGTDTTCAGCLNLVVRDGVKIRRRPDYRR